MEKRRINLNKTILIGNIARDLELKYSASGVAICKFSLAVNRPVKKDGQPDCDFIQVLCFNKVAENLVNYQGKGSKIAVDGSISTGSYKDKDDKTVYTFEVVAQNIQFLSTKQDAQPQQPAQQQQPVFGQQPVQQQGQFNRQEPQYQQMRTSDLAPTFGQPQQSNDPFAASKGPIEVNMNDLPF